MAIFLGIQHGELCIFISSVNDDSILKRSFPLTFYIYFLDSLFFLAGSRHEGDGCASLANPKAINTHTYSVMLFIQHSTQATQHQPISDVIITFR